MKRVRSAAPSSSGKRASDRKPPANPGKRVSVRRAPAPQRPPRAARPGSPHRSHTVGQIRTQNVARAHAHVSHVILHTSGGRGLPGNAARSPREPPTVPGPSRRPLSGARGACVDEETPQVLPPASIASARRCPQAASLQRGDPSPQASAAPPPFQAPASVPLCCVGLEDALPSPCLVLSP